MKKIKQLIQESYLSSLTAVTELYRLTWPSKTPMTSASIYFHLSGEGEFWSQLSTMLKKIK